MASTPLPGQLVESLELTSKKLRQLHRGLNDPRKNLVLTKLETCGTTVNIPRHYALGTHLTVCMVLTEGIRGREVTEFSATDTPPAEDIAMHQHKNCLFESREKGRKEMEKSSLLL